MSAPLDAGAIRVEARVADGAVADVRIASTRPAALGRVLVGRPVAEAPILLPRLLSLCGAAHATAARRAARAAQGAPPDVEQAARDGARTLAERLGEGMRGAALLAGAALAPHDLAAVRDLLAATRAIASGAPSPDASSFARRAADAAQRLGLPADSGAAPEGALGRARAALLEDDVFPGSAPDALRPADDAAVVAALARGGGAFAAAPSLAGRVVETGAFARHWRGATAGGALARRFDARMADMAACRDALLDAVAGAAPAGLVQSGATGERAGYAALESPRGRLYHRLRTTSDGRIVEYAILAPTEWNFHADGPFARIVLGARVGEAGSARRRIERLAALFDPCVAFSVAVLEIAGAGAGT